MRYVSTLVGLGLTAAIVACGSEESPAAHAHAPEEGESFFGQLTQLTFDGQNAEAYWSPDGSRLIFQRTAPEDGCDQQFTVKIDGSELTRVSNGHGATTCGYYYDGGARVLYSSTFHADETCPARPDMSRGYVWGLHDFDVYTSLPDGNDLQRLTDTPGYDAEATLSPDGETIVFTSTRAGDLDIYTMRVDGSDLRRLTDTPGYDGGPFFSRDGTKIVYRAWHPPDPNELAEYRSLLADNLVRPSRMEIFVMNADGSDQRQVTDLGGANFAPYFHPDDRRIIFASNHHETDPRSRNFDLFLVNLDGTGLVQVTRTGVFDGFPMFSPDGTKLAFASNRHAVVEGETNIFVAEWVE